MKYDFTSIMDRHGKDAAAVDGIGTNVWGTEPSAPRNGFDAIPMWVADMNFPTVPTVTEAIIERAKHPAYGYFVPTEAYYDAIVRWHETRNHVNGLTKTCIGYENGVLGGVVSALNVFCSRGDHVLVHAPTYVGFTEALENNGYNMVLSYLKQDEHNIWRMDFDDMEKKITENKIHAVVFCSPHNPTGRVWEQWELEKFAELCEKHNVFIVSDEIWSDIIMPGYKHIPTQSVNEYTKYNTVAMYAPSKTFNLAGLVGSYHIAYCPWIQDRMAKESSVPQYNEMNVLSMHALIGAYKAEGYQWVDELCQTLDGNIKFACQYITDHFEGVVAARPEGTYMLFLDCTDWCKRNEKTLEEVMKAGWDVGVAWQDGRPFHGSCHLRMNLALPFSRVKEAFERLRQYVF